MRPSLSTLLGVGLIAAAALAFELTLTRVFAVAQFYHFAFMAVSLALLGAGASGSILAAWQRRIAPARLALAFALTIPGVYLLINTLPFDSYTIAYDPTQIVLLVVYFLSLAVPFTLAGLVTGALLEREHVHGIYAANLAGSALGSLLALIGSEVIPAEGLVLGSAALGMLGAAALITPRPRLKSGAKQDRPSGPERSESGGLAFFSRGFQSPALLALCLGLFLAAIAPPTFMQVTLSPYKGLVQALRAPGAEHTFQRWNALARVDVVESPSIHMLPGLSMQALITPPPQAAITLDGDNLIPITALPVEEAAAVTDFLPEALAYMLRPGARALVLEPGGGLGVLQALAGGAAEVVAVEPNPHVIAVVRDRYGDFTSGLYRDPRVTVVNQSGRAYLRGADRVFDVIAFPLTDTYRPVTSGAFSLSEDYRYTVEAFAEAYRRLAPGGIIVVTRWLQTPPSETARLFATLIAALYRESVPTPGLQLLAYRSLQTGTFLVRRDRFTPEELAAARAWLAERRFDLTWVSDLQPEELNRFNRLPEESYHAIYAALLDDPDAVIAAYEYDIRPTTDDWPFFFHYFRWGQTPAILANLGHTWQPFGGSGFFVLVALLILVAVASAVLIVGPLVIQNLPPRSPVVERGIGAVAGDLSPRLRTKSLLKRTENASSGKPTQSTSVDFTPIARHFNAGRTAMQARTFAYFLLLGLAFLWVELPLAQRAILFLGHPTLALGVVLAAVLLFSGVGSALSARWPLRGMLLALAAIIPLYPLVILPTLFAVGIGWPLALRALAVGAALAPLGVLMGVPFAGGLARLRERAPGLVAWAWAINGCASVISSVLAVLLALTYNLGTVLLLGALAYAAAAGVLKTPMPSQE